MPPQPKVELPPSELARLPAPDELAKMSRAEIIARHRHWETSTTRRPDEGLETGKPKSSWDMTPEEKAHRAAFREAYEKARDDERAEVAKAPLQFVPVPREGQRLDPSAKKKLDSISPLATAGKLTPKAQKAAREYLRETIEQYNFSRSDPDGKSSDTLKVKANYRARGTHDSYGNIIISKEVAENAGHFAKDMANGVDYKAEIDKEPRTWSEQQRQAELKTRANDYRTFVHEQIHGYGPRGQFSYAYEGVGVLIEEVTTETAARKIVRDQIGIGHGAIESISRPDSAGAYGSYNREIYTATTAIREGIHEVIGSDKLGYGHAAHINAYDVLERTSMRYKTIDEHPLGGSPEGTTTLFAKSIDHEEIERKIGRALTSDERAKIEAAVERRLLETDYSRRKKRR